MENTPRSKRSPDELFNKFVEAEDCEQILHSFQRLVNLLGVKSESPREFYQSLKTKLQSWKCKSLWELLDHRANHKDYDRGKTCEGLQVLVIGAGPIGLRTAIEMALLGAQAVVVEKRQSFARNNVLHLWPFLLDDFRSLGAKRFYGKFCSGAINHISIRRLQSVLLKAALIFGVKVFTGVTFEKVLEPANEDEGWKCHVTPASHPINDFEIDVIIGADGKKNVLPGFAQIEMRGTLAIGITANFVNHYTEPEVNVEEISGIAYQFNPAFFDKLNQQKGIKLENIVYYKDETHYFVMTAVKSSLLGRGVLKQDFGKNSAKLLAPDNINQEELMKYVIDAVHYATKGQLNSFEFKMTDKGKPDLDAFDFTSIKKAESSARIRERKGSKLLIGLVGDSLLEPFWPTGSGCARGVLSALDAAWMVRSFAQDKPPLQILSERENIYRLLSGTSTENLNKNHAAYSINPCSRYKHIPHRKLDEVYHLYDTDDPVNADYSLGSPLSYLGNKSLKKRTISTAAKPTLGKNRNRVKFSTQLSVEYSANSSCSSMEDLTSPRRAKATRTKSEDLTSGGEEVLEISTKKQSKKWKKSKKGRASMTPEDLSEGRGSKKGKRFSSKKQKLTRVKSSPIPEPGAEVEKHSRRRSFFGFGRGKGKGKSSRKSPKTHDAENKPANLSTVEETIVAEVGTNVEGSSRKWSQSKDELVPFKRDSTRRSARDIIAEMEARSANNGNEANISALKDRKRHMRRSITTGNLKTSVEALNNNGGSEAKRPSFKRATSDLDVRTPPPKQVKQETIWDEISSLSPRTSQQAVPVLSQMSPEADKNKTSQHNVSSVVRMAAMLAMATPLLIDERDAGSTKLTANARGLVRSAISKFDSMNDMTPMLKHRDPARPRALDMKDESTDVTDGTVENEETTTDPTLNSVEHPAMRADWEPTPLAFVEGKTQPTIRDVAQTNHAKLTKQESIETCKRLLAISKRFALLDQESTDSPVQKTLNPKIYSKTFIASLQDNGNESNPRTPGKSQAIPSTSQRTPNTVRDTPTTARDTPKTIGWTPRNTREPPTFASPEIRQMEKLLENLTETLSKERAHASLRFLINLFRRIQRNPKEDKFRRIYKSRVKFKKFVWTVRNAKLFMYASGWAEVGSFLVFPLAKSVDEPLNILTKYQGTLVDSPSLLKPVTRARGSKSSTGTPLSIGTPLTTNKRTPLTTGTPLTTTPRVTQERPRVMTPIRKTPLENLSRLVLTPRSARRAENRGDLTWDLETEAPLGEASYTTNDSRRQSLTSSDLSDINFLKNMRLTSARSTPILALSPDPAIMEEIDGLSNTLDDLILSLNDYDAIDSEKENIEQTGTDDCNKLYTTLDYMLDSDEEESFTRDVNTWKSEPNIVQDLNPNELRPKSAFVRVSSLKSSKEMLEFQAKLKQSSQPLLGNNNTGKEATENEDEIRTRRSASEKGARAKSARGNPIENTRIDLPVAKSKTQEIDDRKSGLQSKSISTVEAARDANEKGKESTSQLKKNEPVPKAGGRDRSGSKTSTTSTKPLPSRSKTRSLKKNTSSRPSSVTSSNTNTRDSLKKNTSSNTRDSLKKNTSSVTSSDRHDSLKKNTSSRPSSGTSSDTRDSLKKTTSSVTSSRPSSVTSNTMTSSNTSNAKRQPVSRSSSREGSAVSTRQRGSRKLPSLPIEDGATSVFDETGQSIESGDASSESKTRKAPGNKQRSVQQTRDESKVKSDAGNQRSRPPSGRDSQRKKARAQKRNDITAKLDGLESGFESLSNSPLSQAESSRAESRASQTTSLSSVDSFASSIASSVASTQSSRRTSSIGKNNRRKASRENSIQSSSSESISKDTERKTTGRKGSTSSVSANTRSKAKSRQSLTKTTASEHQTMTSEHQKTGSEHQTMTSEHQTMTSKHQTMTSEHQTMTSEHQTMTSKHQKTGSEHQTTTSDELRSRSVSQSSDVTNKETTTSDATVMNSTENITQRKKGKKSNGKGTRMKEIDNNAITPSVETGVEAINDSFDGITVVKRRDSGEMATENKTRMRDEETQSNTLPHGSASRELTHDDQEDGQENWKMEFESRKAGDWTIVESSGADCENKRADSEPNGVVSQDSGDDKISGVTLDGSRRIDGSDYTDESTVIDNDTTPQNQLDGDQTPTNDSLEQGQYTTIDKSKADESVLPIANGMKHRTYPILGFEERRNIILDIANGSASKKNTTSVNERRSILRIRSQSAENLAWGKKKGFERDSEPRERLATIDIPSGKETKKRGRFHFNLRRNKAGSCSDLNSTIPEGSEPDSSPEKTLSALDNGMTTSPVRISDNGRMTSPDNGMMMSPRCISDSSTDLATSLRKSSPLKRLSPFRTALKRKS